MKEFRTYLSKHLLRFGVVVLLILLLNGIAFAATFYRQIERYYDEASPVEMLEAVSACASPEGIPEGMAQTLREHQIWAMYLGEGGDCLWSVSRPQEVPEHYGIQEAAQFSRGYLADYPVFVRSEESGLLVLGYPKESYMKLSSNYLPLPLVRGLPAFTAGLLVTDFLLLFVAYLFSRHRILKNTNPILSGVDALGDGEAVELSVRGEFSAIAERLNRVSRRLQTQNTARANWISGVSHDIRTPLSMILGYAQRIAQDAAVGEAVRKQAEIIQFQSTRIRDLVQDLNLVSQLEYEMQPLHRGPVRLSKLLRGCAAELLNTGLPETYELSVEITEAAEAVVLEGDERLLTRAVGNLIQNSLKHNHQGCRIKLGLDCTGETATLTVSDDGKGLSEETLQKLKETPHYLESTNETLNLRHGLGLLLVRQIALAQGGALSITNHPQGGCIAALCFPRSEEKAGPPQG